MNIIKKIGLLALLAIGLLALLAIILMPLACDSGHERKVWYEDIYNRGYQSGLVGADAFGNPYHAAQPAEVWLDGWIGGKTERENGSVRSASK